MTMSEPKASNRLVRGLDPRELYEFDLCGYVILRGVFAPEVVDAMNACIDRNQADEIRFKFPFLQMDPMFWDVMTNDRILGVCRDVIGDQFRMDHAFGVQQFQGDEELGKENLHAGPWGNQGAYYYGWHGGRPRCGMISVGVVLEPINTGDGGVILVPGSHKHNQPFVGQQVYHELLGRDLDAWWIHNPTLNKGDVFIFSEAVIHGTRRWIPTERRRRILYFKFTPAHMAWRDPAEQAPLASMARNDLERALVSGPQVGRFNETEMPEWASWFRPATLSTSDFAICRILGNELPPRDKPGSRMAALRHVLDNEPVFPGTRRVWLLNQIEDATVREAIKALLTERGEDFTQVDIRHQDYLTSWTREDRVKSAIGINAARNRAIALGHGIARFAVLLDGDCFFTPEAWQALRSGIEADQQACPARQVYSVPMKRIQVGAIGQIDPAALPTDEPQLVFRNDATWRFKAALPFGAAEKLELLYRLGHTKDVSQPLAADPTLPCTTAGYVLHLNTGDDHLEANMGARHLARNQSVDALLARIDARIAHQGPLAQRVLLKLGKVGRRFPGFARRVEVAVRRRMR